MFHPADNHGLITKKQHKAVAITPGAPALLTTVDSASTVPAFYLVPKLET